MPVPNEEHLKETEQKIKEMFNEFKSLPEIAKSFNLSISKKMVSNIELLMKEIKNISLISATAAPFSLTILTSQLDINKNFLFISFAFFIVNVLILNVGIWYINGDYLALTRSQMLEGISMTITADKVTDTSLSTEDRMDALFDFYHSELQLESKKMQEPHYFVKIIDNLRFFGIICLTLALIFLIGSVLSAIV